MNRKEKTMKMLRHFFKGFVVVTILAATTSLASCSKSDDLEGIKKQSQTNNETPNNGDSNNGNTDNGGSDNGNSNSDGGSGTNTDETAGVKFIEGGTFWMGSVAEQDSYSESDERPRHKVTLSSFKVTVYEITNEQYAKFLTEKGNQVKDDRKWYQGSDIEQKADGFVAKAGRENYPVVNVSWYGANAYAQWVGGKLPTEAQFEYLLREGNTIKNADGTVGNQGVYADSDGTGNDMVEYAWFRNNSGGKLHEIGQRKPNKLGLYDINGNAWEWVADWYARYSTEDQVDPVGATSGKYRIRRGASFSCTQDKTRIANRGTYTARDGRNNMTFRVVFPVDKK